MITLILKNEMKRNSNILTAFVHKHSFGAAAHHVAMSRSENSRIFKNEISVNYYLDQIEPMKNRPKL